MLFLNYVYSRKSYIWEWVIKIKGDELHTGAYTQPFEGYIWVRIKSLYKGLIIPRVCLKTYFLICIKDYENMDINKFIQYN